MRYAILILTLLALGCQEKENCNNEFKNCITMISISDAIPVQFWLNGIPSFNEKIEPGIDRQCFHQLFNADDDIRIQFTDDAGKAFNLEIYNTDDELITTIAFVEVDPGVYDLEFAPEDQTPSITNQMIQLKIVDTEIFSNSDFSDGLDDWENIVSASGQAWAVPFAKASTQLTWPIGVPGTRETYHLRHDFFQTTPAARTINYVIEVTDASIGGLVQASKFYAKYRKNGVAVGVAQDIRNIPTGDYGSTITDSFVTDETDFDEIEFYFTGGITTGAAEGDLNYDVELFEVDNLLEDVAAFSDYLSIKVSHARTKLIQYSNETDYAGIIYDGISPIPNFGIRIEAKFFKERTPEENESEELSTGSVVKLLGTAKKQKLLQVMQGPYYLHNKLTYILQHNTIYIDNLAWVKEENYETEELDEKSPFVTGQTYLTQKNNSYVTNPFS